MPSVTVREYNPVTGAFVGNVSALSLGRIVVGTHSPVKVVDFAFTGVDSVSNVKLGLLHAGGLVVNSEPNPSQETDGSTLDGGKFGIEHSVAFNPSLAAAVQHHFAGLNTTQLASDQRNVAIGTRNATTSQFAYLDIELGGNERGTAAGQYKIFFDFA
jgi:hypothetical protein